MVYSAKVQKNGIAFVSFEFGFMDASYRGQALRTWLALFGKPNNSQGQSCYICCKQGDICTPVYID